MIPRGAANAIIVLIAVVWAVNFFAQFVLKTYQPDPSINGVFGAAVGAALALTRPDKTPGGKQ